MGRPPHLYAAVYVMLREGSRKVFPIFPYILSQELELLNFVYTARSRLSRFCSADG
jgi:hypothetical protein